MALASYDGSLRVRDLAVGTVLSELLASQRFHEGGGTVNLSAADTRLMCDLLKIFHAGGNKSGRKGAVGARDMGKGSVASAGRSIKQW